MGEVEQLVIGVNDFETEEEEVLTHWEKICEANPQSYDEDDARVFYDDQPGYWDTVDPDEFWDEFQDAYQGCWSDDEEFAYSMANDLGAIDGHAKWPNNYIDWTKAARELMMDYWSDRGVYFRRS